MHIYINDSYKHINTLNKYILKIIQIEAKQWYLLEQYFIDKHYNTTIWVIVTQSCSIICDSWTVACQTLLYMKFSRQEYWSR